MKAVNLSSGSQKPHHMNQIAAPTVLLMVVLGQSQSHRVMLRLALSQSVGLGAIPYQRLMTMYVNMFCNAHEDWLVKGSNAPLQKSETTEKQESLFFWQQRNKITKIYVNIVAYVLCNKRCILPIKLVVRSWTVRTLGWQLESHSRHGLYTIHVVAHSQRCLSMGGTSVQNVVPNV
jgi:hypothetical protein